MQHNAVDSLLNILKVHDHSYLPETARNLLNTEKVKETEIVRCGVHIY